MQGPGFQKLVEEMSAHPHNYVSDNDKIDSVHMVQGITLSDARTTTFSSNGYKEYAI